MKISKALADDLRYLAAALEWEEVDKAEVRTSLTENPDFFAHFWTVFAQAHRAGYRYSRDNSYEKFDKFCERNGIPDPYFGMYSGKEIDRVTR